MKDKKNDLLKTTLDSKAKIIYSTHYPFSAYKPHCCAIKPNRYLQTRFSHIVTLGLGSNMGHCVDILESVFKRLFKHPQVQILSTSPLWRNPPFGFQAQNDFYNAVMVLSCAFNLAYLRKFIFYLERHFGRTRKRAFANAPRKIDIDIIFFDALHIKWRHLQIPHKAYKDRASVMLPLSFINVKL